MSFVQVFLALAELEARGFLPPAARVLDLGAGPGPASFAALAKGARSCLLLDRNADALERASRLAKAVRGRDRAPAPISTMSFDLEAGTPLPAGPFDLILACHSANELWKGLPAAEELRLGLFRRAAAELREGAVLLVVEPSAAVTAIPALRLRDRLLAGGASSGQESGAGSHPRLSCAAPCPSSDPCPAIGAGEGRSCHSSWSWKPLAKVAALAAEAGLERDSVKATWFALAKGAARKSEEAPAGGFSGRVVSEGLLNKAGRLRYLVCEGPRLATLSAPADSAQARAAGFLSLSRGDLIEAQGLEQRPGECSFGFGPGSRLSLNLKMPEAGT